MQNKQENKLDERQVVIRFREAISVIRKLPPVRVQGYFNNWPEVFYSRAEIRDMDQKKKFYPPTPEAISKMEETIGWLSLLNTSEERKMLLMRANGIPWDEICKNFGICRSAANKRYQKSLKTIRTNTHKRADVR